MLGRKLLDYVLLPAGMGISSSVGRLHARIACMIAVTPLVYGWLGANFADGMDGETFLATLRACDAVYSEGFYAEGTGVFPEGDGVPARPTTWELTASRAGMVISQKATSMSPPDYKEEGPPAKGRGYPSGIGRQGVVERRTLYWGPDFSSYLGIYRTFEPRADGQMTISPEKKRVVHFYSTKEPSLDLFRMQGVFGLGRGFSRYIEKVDRVTDSGDKLLRCVGTGRYLAWNGRWELLVDPSLTYMVRDARFVREEDQAGILHVSTSGVQWFDGRCVPDSSVWSDSVVSDAPKEIPIAVAFASPDPNDNLLEEAREEVLGTAQMPTTVVDDRGIRSVAMIKTGDVYSTLDRLKIDPLSFVDSHESEINDDVVVQEGAITGDASVVVPDETRGPFGAEDEGVVGSAPAKATHLWLYVAVGMAATICACVLAYKAHLRSRNQ